MSDTDIQSLRIKRDELFSEYLAKGVNLYDGVKEVIESLYQKVRMAVVTSSKKCHFDLIMERVGLRQFLDFVVTTEDIENDKPNPDPYLLALKLSGLKPAECLVVEDTERGVTAAKAAGLTCFAIPNELSRDNDFSKADRVLKNIREILSYIK